MFHLSTRRWVLRALWATAMARALLRYRNPRRRAIGRHQVAFYERAWQQAAADLGGTWAVLGAGIGQIDLAGFRTRVIENTCAIDDPVTLAVLADKPLTYRLLREAGLPVPRHATYTLGDLRPALAFLAESPPAPTAATAGGTARDGVVKPANGTGGGRGVATGIRTPWQLARASAAAAVYGDELLIEEQIAGDNYRLLYLDGELIDAFARRLPTVVGDGRSTIARLIRRVNDERLARGSGLSQVLLSVDLDLRRTLAKQGLSLRSVPPAGKEVVVKTVVNENGGADNATVTDRLCPSVVEDGARAVRALRVRLAGVDVITPDPSRPLRQAGGVILEVNAPPNFYYHYHKSDGSFPVAAHVLRALRAGDGERPGRGREAEGETNGETVGAFAEEAPLS